MQAVFLVFLGGGLGCVARYLISVFTNRYFVHTYPVHTLFANIIGSFIAGFLFFLCIKKVSLCETVKPLLIIGFCGGLTTFSTFSLEVVNMFKEGYFGEAFLYAVLSFAICFLAVFAGGYLAQQID